MTAQLKRSEWAIGVDVGGTKVAAGFLDVYGEIHRYTRVPMNSRRTAEEGLAAVPDAIEDLLKLALEIPIVPARYGAESGIAGGAALCMFPGASEIA